jgi:ketosteroid isomerase-like protein
MVRRFISVALMILVTMAAPAEAQTSGDDEGAVAQAIARSYARIALAEKNERWEELGRYYEDNALVVIPRYAPAGRDDVPEALQNRAPAGYYVASETYIPLDLTVLGAEAIDIESVGAMMKPILDRAKPEPGVLLGFRVMSIWHRDDDGQWRILRQTFTNA